MLSSGKHRDLSDEALVALYKKTEQLDLVGELYHRYMALTLGVCLKYLKDREESRDAAMQIFERLIVTLKEHEITQFKGWLYITARNHCLMQIRTKKGKKFEGISPHHMENGFQEHLQDGFEIESNLTKLEKCIDNLGNEQKVCVQMFYIQQKCYREITESTGFNLNKVKSHIQNGKRNLKICMERNGQE